MRKLEQDQFHQTADAIWEMAKVAKDQGFWELESVLKDVCNHLHAKGSGLRSNMDPQAS